jgi:ATP/maltotriose-dependent transcriptional regulator MalT
MGATHTDELRTQARDAAAQGDWSRVYERLAAIDQVDLSAADLDLYADAAWWLLALDEALGLRQRAYAAFVEGADERRAAFCAWFLWFDYRFKGDMAIASGWLSRAGRHLADAPDCAETGFVTLARAVSAFASGDTTTAESLTRRALELGRRLRSADLTALAMANQGEVAIALGRREEGVALLDDAMCSVIAGELSPFFTGLVYCAVLSACFETADLRRASEWTSAAMTWCDSLPAGSPYHGVCRVHRVEVTTLLGAWTDAEADAVRASEELLALEPASAASAFYAIGEIRRRRGDLAGAESAFVRAHELGHAPQPGLSLLRLQQGRVDDATELLRAPAEAMPAAPLPRAVRLVAQAEIALAAADRARAQEACDGLAALASTGVTRTVVDALGDLVHARLALDRGDRDGACQAARRAGELFRELRLPYEAALARVVLGNALCDSGDADGGRLELEAAHRALVDLGASADAERLAADAGPAADDWPRGLTAREVEVLRLVATGKTNRQVADAMFLSEHTVSRHLQNVFTKLGVSSRAAATAFAYEHQLL